ncbi:Leucine-rich repeat (LRR) family protein [Abeliophyllum distichum]|uniref:Leucine-rich repeat (LRR) family protein n=1 Tax=Abeliophyllum distichum TaxID=126358 RepID=A0ABD1R9C7_9LAMI
MATNFRQCSSLIHIFLIVLSLLDVFVHCKTLKRDVKALNEIKASLGWRVVYAWVGDDPCGDGDLPPWSGVTCSTVSGGDYRVVTELEVYAVSIVGPFPIAVTNLVDLTRLDLHNNKLTGPIPSQVGRLKHLKILNLRWNKLQDAIPPEIGELKQLTHLYLSFNNFKGEIPKELANLPELRYLQLHENRLIGRIPPELGTLQNLRYLDVGNNHLVGTIRELIRIEGCFPALRNLYLNNNYFTGGIPAQLANLTNLEILYLSHNKMSGIVPSGLAHIPRLTYLYLDHNQFSGRIPDAFYKHSFLKEMYIEGNSFRPDALIIGFKLRTGRMESLIKQTRVRFYGAREENKEESSSARDRNIQLQKSQSYREEKKRSQSWMRKRFSRQMSSDYDFRGTDYPTAVAAAAFAIQSHEESTTMDQKKIPDYKRAGPAPSFKKTPTFSDNKTTTTNKPEEAVPSKNAAAGRTPTFPSRQPPAVQPVETRRSSRKPGPGETGADAWEKAEMARIEKRYQKLNMTIENWEKKKKKKARNKLDRTQAELDKRRIRAMQSYRSDITRIEDIAKGASMQADKNRVIEENKVKNKANKIRTTGKLLVTCLC